MTQDTLQQYRRYEKRFRLFQGSCPDVAILTQARQFLSTLTPASVRVAKYALEAIVDGKIGPRKLPHYWRNEPKLEATVFRPAELEQLKLAAMIPMERALVGILFSLRRAEAARLRWQDLDLIRGVVAVPNGKGNKSDWTILTQFAIEALTDWQTMTTQDTVFLGLSSHGIGRQVRALLTRLGLYRPYRGAHAFRRTFATAFLRQHPGELRALQKLMRHESFLTTVRYDFPRPEELAQKVAGLHL